MGFHAFKFAKSLWRCLKPRATDPMVIEGYLRSESHMDEVMRPIVLTFLCENK